ncbi:MAG: FmdB family transcriptional regulator [Meiothermus sp.]
MPTYEYACKNCGEHLEVVQSFKDEPLTSCPSCGGPLRKVFGQIGVVLKGSGFYRTDNRAGGGAKAGAGSEGGGNGSTTSSETSSSGAKDAASA